MHLQEQGDLGRLDIVVDELSRMRALVGGGQGRAGEAPNRIPRALAAIRRGAIK